MAKFYTKNRAEKTYFISDILKCYLIKYYIIKVCEKYLR